MVTRAELPPRRAYPGLHWPAERLVVERAAVPAGPAVDRRPTPAETPR